MFDILLPIKPYWAYLIMKGLKPVEVRKFYIKDPNWSGKFKVYVSKDKTSLKRIPEADRAEFAKYFGKVAFEFEYDYIDDLHEWELSPHGRYEEFEQKRLNEFLKDSCLTINEICNYRQKLPYYKPLYGYRVTDLKIYDKPRELGEFYGYNKELEQRFLDGENYCCYDDKNEYGEAMTECDGENIHNCYRCWEEWSGWCHRITRPPQSWQYVQVERTKAEIYDTYVIGGFDLAETTD